MRKGMLLALALLCLPAGQTAATTLLDLSIGELTRRSEMVAIARVVGQRITLEEGTRASDGRFGRTVYTDTQLAIEEVVTGDGHPGIVSLRQAGGEVMLRGAPYRGIVPDTALLTPGERVLVFLERTRTGRLVICGMTQGKYTLAANPATGELWAHRDTRGIHRLNHREEPPLPFASVPAHEDSMPLRSLVALVRGRALHAEPTDIVTRTPQVVFGEPTPPGELSLPSVDRTAGMLR